MTLLRSTFRPTPFVLALALTAPGLAFAQSGNVTIYGLIDVAARRATNVSTTGASETSMDDGTFTGSRLGFRGREDLGGGVAAFFTMEHGFDPGTGTPLQGSATADYGQVQAPQRFWGRDIYVGLGTSSASLQFGHQYTLAHTVAAKFQPQGNPNNLALSIFSSHHVARQDNLLRVDAKGAGFEVSASKTFGEVAANEGSDAWALAAGWSAGPVYVGGYVQQMNNVSDTETRKIMGLGGNWKALSMLTLYAGAMKRTNAVSPQENVVWTLGANVEVHPDVTLSIAHLADDQSGTAALEGSRKVSYLSASYRFSKRTDIAATIDGNQISGGYTKPSFMGTTGDQTAVTLDLRHKF